MAKSTTLPPDAAVAPRSRRWLLKWLLLGAGLIILALAAYAVGMMLWMSYIPSDLDLSTTLPTDQGVYQISYQPAEAIRVNQLHAWTLHVTRPDGTPVEDAVITVGGDMPQHGHGLPTRPQVTEYLGNGDYLVEGLKFHMPGWWIVEFEIQSAGQSDHVTFNLMLSE